MIHSELYISCLKFLISNPKVYKSHSGVRLIDHLLETHNLLLAWDLDESIVIAGLFHSAYGNKLEKDFLWDINKRIELQNILGKKNELLIWDYSNHSFSEVLAQVRTNHKKKWVSLLYIQLANFIEQHSRLKTSLKTCDKILITESLDYVSQTVKDSVLKII